MEKSEAMKKIAELVEQSNAIIAEAKTIADQNGIPFLYNPVATETPEDDFESSDEGWNSSQKCW